MAFTEKSHFHRLIAQAVNKFLSLSLFYTTSSVINYLKHVQICDNNLAVSSGHMTLHAT